MSTLPLRRFLLAASALGLLAGCQPAAPTAADADAAADAMAEETGNDEVGFEPSWLHEAGVDLVNLVNQEAPNSPAFTLSCAKAGPTLTFSAPADQVGISNRAAPYALVASGATFPAEAVPGADGDLVFSVRAPLTAEMLAAVRDAVTVRILLNDGYAFAESGIDPGEAFEIFAGDCAALAGVTPPL
jgi:hypothetical protein